MPLIAFEIVHAMGNDHAPGRAREVMVEGVHHFLRVELARAVEIAQQLLLLGIEAHNWILRLQIRLLELRDVLKLGVAVGMVTHSLGLLRFALDIVMLAQERFDHGPAHRGASGG